jgi:hypothetical protein
MRRNQPTKDRFPILIPFPRRVTIADLYTGLSGHPADESAKDSANRLLHWLRSEEFRFTEALGESVFSANRPSRF